MNNEMDPVEIPSHLAGSAFLSGHASSGVRETCQFIWGWCVCQRMTSVYQRMACVLTNGQGWRVCVNGKQPTGNIMLLVVRLYQ